MTGSAETAAANALPVRTAADVAAYHTAYDSAHFQWLAGATLAGVGVAATGVGIWLWSRGRAVHVAVVPDPARGGLAIAGRW